MKPVHPFKFEAWQVSSATTLSSAFGAVGELLPHSRSIAFGKSEASTSSKNSEPKMVAYTLVSHRIFITKMLEMMVGDKDD